ncbi:MAG: hypothetical protein CO135_00840 [Candidatus Levybacteria bacterium CG_4_9_14_3_um_filter_35_16]|nr:MAG: hypothetical protein COW87_00570 [Candidatus Levybacteria bacterium CG22_combo_CG10-13_8_21_14_all_35_11]PIY94282.1 MAG: hypothetical protein COY68_03395 [Candidatus Levybacteria bacterium CG_4_10_14_0_8_um_filter_35_23]PJA91504.1 MAG: hypothetical protein CO135_00840 [Candidatus Levybacteria bacterium CG_4_9_14_3_um_filter_35_16]PJC54133.1 MAG: hypothetical protein CO028_04000 [Candidatus Levybacteria bacterium CG_4_9_14_0_2_um_filter_35_21]
MEGGVLERIVGIKERVVKSFKPENPSPNAFFNFAAEKGVTKIVAKISERRTSSEFGMANKIARDIGTQYEIELQAIESESKNKEIIKKFHLPVGYLTSKEYANIEKRDFFNQKCVAVLNHRLKLMPESMTAEIYFFGKLVSASEFAKIAESTKNAGIDPIIDKNCMPSLF